MTPFVDASKARADSLGNGTPVGMDDLVETITVVVPRRPARAGVDPRRRLIERGDNVAAVVSDITRSGGR